MRRKRWLSVSIVCVAVFAIAAPGASATQVTIDADSAAIETLQDVGISLTHTEDRGDNDFFSFGRTLDPPTLKNSEGKSDAFAQQASTIVTSQQPPFPAGPIFGIGTSNRAIASGKKLPGGSGAPVSDPNGSFTADFETDGSTPFQFSGFINANDTDTDDCATVTVDLTGPFHRSFAVSDGGDCGAPQPNQKGFVIEDDLPAGAYTLDVEYDAEVAPNDTGEAFKARAVADVNLSFFPPETRITSANVNANKGKAEFRFDGTGKFHGFDCALVRGHRTPHFRDCTSPKQYRHLRRGHYKFEVRALGRGGPDATPATKSFSIH